MEASERGVSLKMPGGAAPARTPRLDTSCHYTMQVVRAAMGKKSHATNNKIAKTKMKPHRTNNTNNPNHTNNPMNTNSVGNANNAQNTNPAKYACNTSYKLY